MKCTGAITAFLLVAVAGGAQAQDKASAAAAATGGIAALYQASAGNLLKTADQLSDELYTYQPTKEVRTSGQILGHVADAADYFCAILAGSPAEYGGSAEKLEGKAALSAALKASFDRCDAAVAKLTDADLARPVKIFGRDGTISMALTFLTAHNWEHYGNLVTYMRANGMVPPSSQQN